MTQYDASVPQCVLRLYWMREPSLGVLRSDPLAETAANSETVARTIADAIDLHPDCARSLADKILACVPQARNWCGTDIEVLFPLLDRRDWHKRAGMLEGLEPAVDNDGRIVVRGAGGTAFESDVRMTLTAGLPGMSTTFSFTHTDGRELSRFQARTWLPHLLAGYRFALEDIASIQEWEFEKTVEAGLTLSMTGECASVWLRAPAERCAEYFPFYNPMAKAVQAALRRWLPYVLLREPAQCSDPDFGIPLIVYHATRPFRGEPPASFTYDLLSTATIDSFYRLALRDIDPAAARIETALEAAGAAELAKRFRASRRRSTVEAIRKQHRSRSALNSLLVADTVLVEALAKLGLKGQQIGGLATTQPRAAVRATSKVCDEFVSAWTAKLKRVYANADVRFLAPLLLMEATRALNPGVAIRAALRVRSGGSERVLFNRAPSPESCANHPRQSGESE